jgi:hypothetical protein
MATTTNYGWTTPDNTAYVKDGASAIRSLGSSIDTTLNSITTGKNVGLSYINTLSWASGTSSASIDSVFTTAFPHYRLVLEVEGGGTADSSIIRLQLRAAGAGLTGNHTTTFKTVFSTATSLGDNTLGAGNFMSFITLTSSGGPTASSVDITNVASSSKKKILSGVGYRDLFVAWGGGRYDSTTAADGFNVSVASGTLGAGSVRIYGYK